MAGSAGHDHSLPAASRRPLVNADAPEVALRRSLLFALGAFPPRFSCGALPAARNPCGTLPAARTSHGAPSAAHCSYGALTAACTLCGALWQHAPRAALSWQHASHAALSWPHASHAALSWQHASPAALSRRHAPRAALPLQHAPCAAPKMPSCARPESLYAGRASGQCGDRTPSSLAAPLQAGCLVSEERDTGARRSHCRSYGPLYPDRPFSIYRVSD